MEILRIYLCGAHSTGKTTLLNDLKVYLNVRFEEEVARTIIKEHGWTRNEFLPTTNPGTFVQLNKEILQAQILIDAENTDKGRDFICDRGVDPFVYVDCYVGSKETEKLYQVDGVDQWLNRMRESLVFVLYPHKECISDDGVRLPPSIEELHTFTHRLEDVLNKHNIKFHVISVLDQGIRVNDIINIVKQVKPDIVKY